MNMDPLPKFNVTVALRDDKFDEVLALVCQVLPSWSGTDLTAEVC